jgi:hypothetical protein
MSLAAEELGVVVNLPPEIDHGHDHSYGAADLGDQGPAFEFRFREQNFHTR